MPPLAGASAAGASRTVRPSAGCTDPALAAGYSSRMPSDGSPEVSSSYASEARSSGKRWVMRGVTSSWALAIRSSTASRLRCSVQRTKPTG